MSLEAFLDWESRQKTDVAGRIRCPDAAHRLRQERQ